MHIRSSALAGLGRLLLGAGAAGMGILCLAFGDIEPGLEPVPAWVPGHPGIGYVTGVLLLVSGAGILIGRRAAKWGAILGTVFLVFVALLQWPRLVYHLQSGGMWGTAFEALALAGAAWIASGRMVTFGRICYGISLPVFGALHFVFALFISNLIPAWIPARYAWTLFIGAAFVAAGISILTGIKARLAAGLMGIMFAIWVVIVHAPRVVANPHNHDEWSSLMIALAMSGGAWLVASGAGSSPIPVDRSTEEKGI